MKLGKLPARPDSIKLKLENYVTPSKLPKAPASFGHEGLISEWGTLGNDRYGDCVFAGAAHETLMWNKEAGSDVQFSDSAVLSDYSAVTGFNPNDPNTDSGTDMQAAASYRRKTGIVDAKGKRHQVAAYLSIAPGDIQQHYIAMYLFGAVGIGFRFPEHAFKQFKDDKKWTYNAKSNIVGGHYVPLVAKRHSKIWCVTWGRLQPMTEGFFKRYNDESVAYVSLEALKNGKSPEGFDAQALLDDLNQLK